KEFMWVDGVVMLTNSLYDREKKQNLPPLYSFQELQKEIEDKNHQLKMLIFLNSMRTAHEAIDAFALARVTITSHHMDRKKADIAELHDDFVD
ncbi:10765_t:CDS:2, partial [Racocetra persica]